MDSGVYPTYLMAVCVCDESESPDCQPKTKDDSWSYVSGALLGKMK